MLAVGPVRMMAAVLPPMVSGTTQTTSAVVEPHELEVLVAAVVESVCRSHHLEVAAAAAAVAHHCQEPPMGFAASTVLLPD